MDLPRDFSWYAYNRFSPTQKLAIQQIFNQQVATFVHSKEDRKYEPKTTKQSVPRDFSCYAYNRSNPRQLSAIAQYINKGQVCSKNNNHCSCSSIYDNFSFGYTGRTLSTTNTGDQTITFHWNTHGISPKQYGNVTLHSNFVFNEINPSYNTGTLISGAMITLNMYTIMNFLSNATVTNITTPQSFNNIAVIFLGMTMPVGGSSAPVPSISVGNVIQNGDLWSIDITYSAYTFLTANSNYNMNGSIAVKSTAGLPSPFTVFFTS